MPDGIHGGFICAGNWEALVGCGGDNWVTWGARVALLHIDILDILELIGLFIIKVLVTEPALLSCLIKGAHSGPLVVVCVSGIHFDGNFRVCWVG